MLEEPDKLIGGLQVILRLFPNAKGVLAVEDNKPDCIKLLTEMTSDEPRITVKKLKTKYPQGSERQLIFAVTGGPSIPPCFLRMQAVSWTMWIPWSRSTVR